MVGDEPLGVLARDAKTSEKKKRVSLQTEAEHKTERRKNGIKKDQTIWNTKIEIIFKNLVIILEKK